VLLSNRSRALIASTINLNAEASCYWCHRSGMGVKSGYELVTTPEFR